MMSRRWRLPVAIVAAVVIAEGAVWLLRPDERIDPVAVSAQSVAGPRQLERADDYAGGMRLLGLGAIVAQGAVLAFLVARPPRRATRALERAGLGRTALAVALAGALLILVVTAAALPFAALAHERAVDFGRSTQSWAGWVEDRLKSTGIAVVLAAAGAALFAMLMRRFPRGWWVAGAGAVVAIELLFVWLTPVVLDPLFNRYADLPQGRTRADVEELARRTGLDVGDVLVVDASRRTTAANAYVTGIGHTKRVVLYDTLLRDFTAGQVRLVVAHELGHVKQRDLARGMLWVAIVAPGAMVAIMLLTRRWSARAGTEPGTAGSMPSFALALALVAFATTTIGNQLSRSVEARADAYSLELTGEARQFESMERRLARINLTDPDPPGFFHFVFGTHPRVVERIGMGRAYERRGG